MTELLLYAGGLLLSVALTIIVVMRRLPWPWQTGVSETREEPAPVPITRTLIDMLPTTYMVCPLCSSSARLPWRVGGINYSADFGPSIHAECGECRARVYADERTLYMARERRSGAYRPIH